MGSHVLPPGIKPTMYVVVVDDQAIELFDAADTCNPYEPNDRCGGCGSCLLMQCHHWGTDVEPVTTDRGLVLLDQLMGAGPGVKR